VSFCSFFVQSVDHVFRVKNGCLDPLNPRDINGHEIEEILEERKLHGELAYLVKYAPFGPFTPPPSLQYARCLIDCSRLLGAYYNRAYPTARERRERGQEERIRRSQEEERVRRTRAVSSLQVKN